MHKLNIASFNQFNINMVADAVPYGADCGLLRVAGCCSPLGEILAVAVCGAV